MEAVDPPRSREVLGRLARGVGVVEVERDPDLRVRRVAAQDLDCAAVRQQQVVCGCERVRLGLAARSVVPPAVTDPRHDPGLVVRDPVADAVAEALGDRLDVFGERIDGVAHGPAARVLQHLRGVPVEEGHVRGDPVAEQLVDQAVVEVEARGVDAALALRQDAGPGDREAERVEAELAHQRDVVAVAVVEVARDCPVVAVPDLPRRGAEPVPHAFAAAVFVGRSFDLVRGGCGAPHEVGWEQLRELTGHGLPLGWQGRVR